MEHEAIVELLAIAAGQHRLVSVTQAARAGVSAEALRHAAERGWLRMVRRGVVAVAGGPASAWEPLMAAALAAGPDAVISHVAAASVHRFHGILLGAPEVTVPRGRRVRLTGVRVHQSIELEKVDVEERSGVLLTAPVRTVIDISQVTGDYLLGRILDQGSIQRLWTPQQIDERLQRLGGMGRPGTVRLRRLLAARIGEGHQDDDLEMRVLRVIKQLGRAVPEPVPHYQLVLRDRVIDMDLAWPRFRIDGEIDGLEAHTQRSDFDRDRLRANLLAANGWRLVHWTSTMDDDTIVAQILPYFEGR